MGRVLIAALLAAPGLLAASEMPAVAKNANDMACSRYMAMRAAGRMAAVNSMRSGMSAANNMASSREMAGKVAAICKGRPGMMVPEAMKEAMPQ